MPTGICALGNRGKVTVMVIIVFTAGIALFSAVSNPKERAFFHIACGGNLKKKQISSNFTFL